MYSIDDSYIDQALKLVSTVDYRIICKYKSNYIKG